MAAIAGICLPEQNDLVKGMLEKLSHRGGENIEIKDVNGVTIGTNFTKIQSDSLDVNKNRTVVRDDAEAGHQAQVRVENGGVYLKRDPLGVAPLYYGYNAQNALCFASEVKALLGICSDIKQVKPGTEFNGEKTKEYFSLNKKEPLANNPESIAKELKQRLENSVKKRVDMGGKVGSWLSGGLDSSTMAALAKKYVDNLHTFAAGTEGAPDIEFARIVADYIGSNHHEVILDFDSLLELLPEVIYHLESFDALLVRSSVMNFAVAKKAGEYSDAVFSGEGGDELFAGYSYLKGLNQDELADELVDITGRLHNTALQRVDRSASAHGTVAHVGFLDPEVVDYAMQIPVEYKMYGDVEKWILRRSMDGELPESVLERDKAKFWQGAGVVNKIAEYADMNVTDKDFEQERQLQNGWVLNSKEELLYYRYFKEHFGDLEDLSWMGRSKGAPEV
jgi:asparagine synthase (glutamine-hydrolysing)